MSYPTEFFTADDLHGLSVTTNEFTIVTADHADGPHVHFQSLLARVRSGLGMDIAFVAEFVDGRRVFRHVDAEDDAMLTIEPGQSNALELTYCQRVVDGRLPLAIPDTGMNAEAAGLEVTQALEIASYLSAPIVLENGLVYGTLCCIGHQPHSELGEAQVQALRSVADLIASSMKATVH
ncbi:MAG: GAF domain-containing protein [Burkholderiales bacterium]|nr:MAG: GAF domain-containing protein [Burkholderiales bacterium]